MVRTTTGVVWEKAEVSGGMGKAVSLGGSARSDGVLAAPGGLLSRPIEGASCGGNARMGRARVSDGVALVKWSFDQITCEEEANQNHAARSASAPATPTHALHHRRGFFPVYSAITSLAIFAEIRRWP